MSYHWCLVPECKNTSVKTPQKLWIQVPSDVKMRNTWLKLARRDPKSLSTKTRLYFCEDHFDLENDMENYTEYKIMGSVKRIRIKPNTVPTRFDCQAKRKHKSTSSEPRHAFIKRQRMSTIKEIEDTIQNENYAISLPSCSQGGMSVILNHSHTEGKNKLPNNFFKKRRLNKSIDQELTEDHVSSHDLGLEFTRISGSSSEIVPSRIKNEVSSSLEELTTNKLADPEDSLEIKYEPLDESDFVEDCHGIKMEKCEIEVQYHTDNKNYDFKLPGLCGESTSSMNSIHSSTVPLDSKDSLQMDENDRYGKLVALQLRQLTLKNSVEAQGKINELLTAYRLKELENFNRS